MSFFSGIKRALGFGADYEENDEDTVVHDGTDDNADEQSIAENASECQPEVCRPAVDPDVKARIFEGAVAVFNEALPDFLRRSVDPELQRRRLAESLDKGVDEYLDSLVRSAEIYAETRLRSAADSSRRESERLRGEMENLEQQRSALREQQLSADRRRRALADRVTDLEAQLAKSDAEREQFELENRSLLNKLKVADIQPSVVEEMSKEIESLRKQLREGTTPDAVSAPELQVKLDEALKARDEAVQKLADVQGAADGMIAKARAEAAGAAAACEKAERAFEDCRTQQQMQQQMYNDLQSQLAAERETVRKLQQEKAEAVKIADSVVELQAQMTQVEEIIRKRDERIARLKAANKQLKDRIAELEEVAKRAVERDDGLFNLPPEPSDADKKNKQLLDAEVLSAMEDDFECPDWFVSEPAPGETSPLLASDSEFGYQEPPKKPKKPENDAQLSLF